MSSGPLVQIRARHESGRVAAIGEEVAASPPPTLEARCEASPAAELRLVGNGETIARRRVEGAGRIEEVARAGDRWCCAELWSPGGEILLAVTSPIYLA